MSALTQLAPPIVPVLRPRARAADELAGFALSLMLAQRPNIIGQSLGLIGFGPVARAVSVRAKGLGMQPVVHAAAPVDLAAIERCGARPVDDLAELLQMSHIVSVHAASRRLPVVGQVLDQMSDKALFVHIGSVATLDQMALAHALMFGCLGGAALAIGPADRVHPLLAQCDGFSSACPPDLAA